MEKNDITPKLILLSEFLDQSKRKDKEIAFYERELKKIEEKLYWLRREKDLTQTIISIISEEKVLDIKEEMETRLLDKNGVADDKKRCRNNRTGFKSKGRS